MESRLGTLDFDVYRNCSSHPAHAIADFLAAEHLECYDNWSDKAELDTLVELGELPHPGRLRQTLIEE